MSSKKVARISELHSNIEALEAVLKDINSAAPRGRRLVAIVHALRRRQAT